MSKSGPKNDPRGDSDRTIADSRLSDIALVPGRGKSQSGDGRAPQFCGDIDIRIARDGTWFYHGTPIGRKPLVKLFSTVLRRDEAGDYWLTTPAEDGRIQVEDVPFLAVEMTVAGSGAAQTLSFRTNVDDWVTADADHPIRVAENDDSGEPTPYIMVRDRLEARINRAVYYDLVARGEFEGAEFGVWSCGTFFVLGRLDEAEQS